MIRDRPTFDRLRKMIARFVRDRLPGRVDPGALGQLAYDRRAPLLDRNRLQDTAKRADRSAQRGNNRGSLHEGPRLHIG
jgi:hypothetical protein